MDHEPHRLVGGLAAALSPKAKHHDSDAHAEEKIDQCLGDGRAGREKSLQSAPDAEAKQSEGQ